MAERGFIDLHTHGWSRWDTRGGSAEAICALAEVQGAAGAAAILPTVYAAPVQVMRRNVRSIALAMQMKPRAGAARILGAHLEGPFLNPSRAGALRKEAFVPPSLSVLKGLLGGFEDVVRVITVAPELKGAPGVIERCASLGIRANMGHSEATWKQALRGKEAGAAGVTHLFNAMRPFHHREAGLAGLGLLDEELYVEVIADGVHLSAEALRLVFRVKRPERILLVSDSIKGPMYRGKVLQGSTKLLPEAFSVLEQAGVARRRIALASRENPRRYLGLRSL
jgi:N-acetylglucosamine-6-phosphate deacetylase